MLEYGEIIDAVERLIATYKQRMQDEYNHSRIDSITTIETGLAYRKECTDKAARGRWGFAAKNELTLFCYDLFNQLPNDTTYLGFASSSSLKQDLRKLLIEIFKLEIEDAEFENAEGKARIDSKIATEITKLDGEAITKYRQDHPDRIKSYVDLYAQLHPAEQKQGSYCVMC